MDSGPEGIWRRLVETSECNMGAHWLFRGAKSSHSIPKVQAISLHKNLQYVRVKLNGRNTTVYEEQLESKFSRETENVFTLSLYYDVDGIGANPSNISVKETVLLWSDH